MKRSLFSVALMLAALAASSMAGCASHVTLLTPDGSEVEAQSLPAEQRKALEKQQDEIRHNLAVEALRSADFVLEVDKITGKYGRSAYVNRLVNFISLTGRDATVQISPLTASSGVNGVGGITLGGSPSDILMTSSADGGVTYTMNVMGPAISASVTISLMGGSNRATAIVKSNFHSDRITVSGELVPSAMSSVHKGRSI